MQLELIIKGEVVEQIEMPITEQEHPTYAHRAAVILDYRQYLMRKYSIDIMITNRWEIVLVAQSKLNYLTDEQIEECELMNN